MCVRACEYTPRARSLAASLAHQRLEFVEENRRRGVVPRQLEKHLHARPIAQRNDGHNGWRRRSAVSG